jgi:hypothetical protein
VRRDKDNNMVDKKGRRVNKRGYLIDNQGNVINKEGKLMFEKQQLSQDQEIPKIFPFMKFNVDSVKGHFERDPGGHPMLQKGKDGRLYDNNGNLVNEKGYLVDPQGNVINRNGRQVFPKHLVEKDGEIPKVFRTGLLRKDTQDDFEEIMNDITVLEQEQRQAEAPPQRREGKKSKEHGRKPVEPA